MSRLVKHFIDDKAAAQVAACRGFVALHPALQYDEISKVVYRNAPDRASRVTLLGGGGSGHEPAHAGFVGQGMLDAAVAGAIFASPSLGQIERGLRLIASPRGTLMIVKNYTGDKLNFGLAADRARFSAGLDVRMVVVGDDVSIGRSRSRVTGRRGLAGTVLVHKVAGAAAEDGTRGLTEVAEVAEWVAARVATIGVGLDACAVPGQAYAGRLAHDEIEIGIGIHNEPGSRKVRPRPELPALVKELLGNILNADDSERNYLQLDGRDLTGDNFVLMVNNLGGLSVLELVAITSVVTDALRSEYDIEPVRTLAGTFLSALDGQGFSITLLHLPKEDALSQRVLGWLDAPSDASGWTLTLNAAAWERRSQNVKSEAVGSDVGLLPNSRGADVTCDEEAFLSILESVKTHIIAAEPEITRLDTLAGDGDCGTTLVDGITGILEAAERQDIDLSQLSRAFMSMSDVVSSSMGGTSGALYAVFFASLAASIAKIVAIPREGATQGIFYILAEASKTALEKLKQVTAAREGDRTLMDAIIPLVESLSMSASRHKTPVEALEAGVAVAKKGADATAQMESRFGRSAYVGAEEGGDSLIGIPDPGALGIVAIAEAILEALAHRRLRDLSLQ